MKKFFLIAGVLIASLFNAAQAQEINEQNPYEMVKDVGNRTFDRIKNSQDEIKKDPEVLRTIMKDELLPHIDYQFAAFKVLGRYFTSLPKDKMQEYVQVFRQYLITTYAVAMGYYDNQTVTFEPEADFSGKKAVTVRAIVQDTGRPDIKVAFQVRKDSKTNEWKAYDMSAEGISLLDSKRSEFEPILRQEGIDAILKLMREKIEQPLGEQVQEAQQKEDA
ncbi:MlaC/ttg2D family ABC transporter substrate-binding protein [Alteromonas confluentis]|uniref:Toluene tolerance protein n=1 Tax=Alteromonas confluentis TaxID=1656094 RepID=A0A1E7ZFB4_9ALTE|nr:ABC transporter substrate-binding protein [Alteromonas confluentis]OFC72132.1 toluene tolerance protein [Alteromonas confluentis]